MMVEHTLNSAQQWWQSKRRIYNEALVIAGIIAFICYASIVWLCESRMPFGLDITIFTTIVQAIGYLVAMGIANVFFSLGAVAENLVRPRNVGRFRTILFRLGLWFSVALPFTIPVITLLGCAGFIELHGKFE